MPTIARRSAVCSGMWTVMPTMARRSAVCSGMWTAMSTMARRSASGWVAVSAMCRSGKRRRSEGWCSWCSCSCSWCSCSCSCGQVRSRCTRRRFARQNGRKRSLGERVKRNRGCSSLSVARGPSVGNCLPSPNTGRGSLMRLKVSRAEAARRCSWLGPPPQCAAAHRLLPSGRQAAQQHSSTDQLHRARMSLDEIKGDDCSAAAAHCADVVPKKWFEGDGGARACVCVWRGAGVTGGETARWRAYLARCLTVGQRRRM